MHEAGRLRLSPEGPPRAAGPRRHPCPRRPARAGGEAAGRGAVSLGEREHHGRGLPARSRGPRGLHESPRGRADGLSGGGAARPPHLVPPGSRGRRRGPAPLAGRAFRSGGGSVLRDRGRPARWGQGLRRVQRDERLQGWPARGSARRGARHLDPSAGRDRPSRHEPEAPDPHRRRARGHHRHGRGLARRAVEQERHAHAWLERARGARAGGAHHSRSQARRVRRRGRPEPPGRRHALRDAAAAKGWHPHRRHLLHRSPRRRAGTGHGLDGGPRRSRGAETARGAAPAIAEDGGGGPARRRRRSQSGARCPRSTPGGPTSS